MSEGSLTQTLQVNMVTYLTQVRPLRTRGGEADSTQRMPSEPFHVSDGTATAVMQQLSQETGREFNTAEGC